MPTLAHLNGSGVSFGLALLGVNRTLIALAPAGQRAGLVAAIFIISFLALSIPVVIAGVATAHFGLHRPGLLHGDGRARRGGSRQLDAPRARPRPPFQSTSQVGPDSTAAIACVGTGRVDRPGGMVPWQGRRPRVEYQARSARIRDTAGDDQRRRKLRPGRTGSARRPSPSRAARTDPRRRIRQNRRSGRLRHHLAQGPHRLMFSLSPGARLRPSRRAGAGPAQGAQPTA